MYKMVNRIIKFYEDDDILLCKIPSGGGIFPLQGDIAVALDFPTLAAVQNGWAYNITADVTDNDPTKTNTNQSFKKGDIIAWNGGTWSDLTGIELWGDDGSEVRLFTERDIDLQGKGLKDDNVTTAILLGDSSNTSFDTTNKTIVGAVNEINTSLTSDYLKRDGSTTLTADWDAGQYNITSKGIIISDTTNTAQLTISSTASNTITLASDGNDNVIIQGNSSSQMNLLPGGGGRVRFNTPKFGIGVDPITETELFQVNGDGLLDNIRLNAGGAIKTSMIDTDTLLLQAYDVDGTAYTTFLTMTAGNTPTCVLSGDITSVTQSPGDNTTKLATTAFVTAAVSIENIWDRSGTTITTHTTKDKVVVGDNTGTATELLNIIDGTTGAGMKLESTGASDEYQQFIRTDIGVGYVVGRDNTDNTYRCDYFSSLAGILQPGYGTNIWFGDSNGKFGVTSLTASQIVETDGSKILISAAKGTAYNQSFETSTSEIKMDGIVSVGVSSNIARADHIHPSDTTKADDSAVVHLTGNESIAGEKDFTDGIKIDSSALITSIATGTADNDIIVTKGYVDDAVSGENLFDRTGTTIITHNSGDNLQIGVTPSLFVDSPSNTVAIGTNDITTAIGGYTPSGFQFFVKGDMLLSNDFVQMNVETDAPAYHVVASSSYVNYEWHSSVGGTEVVLTQQLLGNGDYTRLYENYYGAGNHLYVENYLFDVYGGSPKVVFNNGAYDLDFIIKGDTDANLVYVDASTDRVGFGTATPSEKVDINGNMKSIGAIITGLTDGIVKSSTGTLSGGNSVTLTSEVSGVLPIANGGTNSSTALNNDRVIISSGGAIVESATITTAELGLLNGIVSVSTGTGDNDKFVTQGYVDDAVSGENIWDRVTGTPNYVIPHIVADDIGATGARITKGWFTDLEVTNYPTVNGTSINNNGVISDLTSAEVDQLENINTTTISTTQWGYLGAMNQGVATTNSPSFTGLTVSGLTTANGIVQTNGSGVLSSSTALPDGTTGTTQSVGDNTTKISTTAFVVNEISNKSGYVAPPITPTTTGTRGQWSYSSGYLYKCVATNTWVRSVVATTWT